MNDPNLTERSPLLYGVAVYKAGNGEICVVCEDALRVMSPDFDIFTTPEERRDQLREALAYAVKRNRLVLCDAHRDTLAGAIAVANEARDREALS